ncbi:N6-adenine-specific DNA methylase [Candidatus Kinetoplastibacterium desouzaii TCC079E]|uniref:N6-adenine-specific DNA methylase n=1 Tax=Candidatus Kinetoplastidibacterium desouzai TCC079E TaxID=1208919 RepID=M1LMN9_9PROT|nr:class I SAM-dependent RNA methyltransferase [Candidatus Kinetoplastibacterium desouzaii]AGF46992.1 N6-adenine-specific DNA methylase [Candidatus Kinetoplastibacterium desouzaii TCC079E]
MTDNYTNEYNNQYIHKLDHKKIDTGNIFNAFAVAPYGLEEELLYELQSIGFKNIIVEKSGCSFQANMLGIQYANLHLRIASRILIQLKEQEINTEKDILELTYNINWQKWFSHKESIKIKTFAINSDLTSLQYCNLLVKDGICDYFRDKENERPSVNKINPDIRIYSFIKKKKLTLYLDTSGESLFKRGWRLNKGETPIKENLASGILSLSKWEPNKTLLDPFCGSGTILIEAYCIAASIPSGINRKFAFENFKTHDVNQWNNLIKESKENIKNNIETEIIGCDIDKNSIEYAKQNLVRSGIETNKIRFINANACDLKINHSNGFIVTNPPYGIRTPSDDIWSSWAHNLKQNYFNWNVNIISSDLLLPKKMRLKPIRKIPIFNGKLECRLFKFEIVKDSYRKIKNTV